MKMVLALFMICASYASDYDLPEDLANTRYRNVESDYANDRNDSGKSFPYQYKLDGTIKKAIVAGFAKAGAVVAWFYGETILYDACYKVAAFFNPTRGIIYIAYGHSSYHHAGIACSSSKYWNTMMTAACGTLSGALAYFSINTFEKTMTLMGRFCGK